MLRASSARSCQCLGLSSFESGTVGARGSKSGGGTIPAGLAFHKLDRCHAHTKRVPTARRRMPETREREHADVREVGIARTCGRVPPGCRGTGAPLASKPYEPAAPGP